MSEWTIWRSGIDLFHLLDVADYPAMIAELDKLPVNIILGHVGCDLIGPDQADVLVREQRQSPPPLALTVVEGHGAGDGDGRGDRGEDGVGSVEMSDGQRRDVRQQRPGPAGTRSSSSPDGTTRERAPVRASARRTAAAARCTASPRRGR